MQGLSKSSLAPFKAWAQFGIDSRREKALIAEAKADKTDMSLPRQIVPSLIFKSLKSPWQLCCFNLRSEPSHLIHTVTKPTAPNNVVKAICNAFRSGWTWDTLSREFHNIEFNEQLVEKILLELEQPIDAKWALGFFHWAAQSKFPTLPSVLLLSHSHLGPSSAELER
ncbi:hypothetical protein L484_022776 [Morus notabilis]|uniref:Uncharacterized protein n=1 Tax=Morus notabilis TaxID=981085 RepID=W9T0I4_9ROSA|nr:hypothetical protein L484_022776 [Morus notabilis]